MYMHCVSVYTYSHGFACYFKHRPKLVVKNRAAAVFLDLILAVSRQAEYSTLRLAFCLFSHLCNVEIALRTGVQCIDYLVQYFLLVDNK